MTYQSFWIIFHWQLVTIHALTKHLSPFHPFWYLHLSFFLSMVVELKYQLALLIWLEIYREPCVSIFDNTQDQWRYQLWVMFHKFRCTWFHFHSSWILYLRVFFQNSQWYCHFRMLRKLRIQPFILLMKLIWQPYFLSTYQLSYDWGRR